MKKDTKVLIGLAIGVVLFFTILWLVLPPSPLPLEWQQKLGIVQ